VLLSGDFLRENWSDGDLVLMNSTCYSPALMESISSQAERLRPGAIVVSLTKALKSNKFQLLSKKKYQMSWSNTQTHSQRPGRGAQQPLQPLPSVCSLV